VPITYRIDYERRIVLARGYGIFTDEDAFNYQREVWSGKDISGFNELIDMTHVSEIAAPSTQRIQDLASVAALMDLVSAPSRFAIVAPSDRTYALARAYRAYRDREPRSTKDVGVFRTLAEAFAYLGIKDAPVLPELPPTAAGA